MSEETMTRDDLDLAYFSERAMAFGIDLTLAVLGYFLTMKVAFPFYGLLTNPNSYGWSLLWLAIFLVYQAVANAEGRRSWGKAMVGIQVCDLEGKPLTLGASFLRSGGYLVSSILYLGFVWPLFDHRVQAWHDKLAGSLVVQSEARAGRPTMVAGAWAVAGVVIMHWVWVFVLSTPYYRLKTVASARSGLETLVKLEEDYRQRHGRYTDNLFALANHSGAPDAFIASLGMIFDTSKGVELKTDGSRLHIRAYARDDRRTPVQLRLN